MIYQDKNSNYIDAEAYDKRAESSILEKYVLGLWQPFLKNKIRQLSTGKIVADLGCGTCEYVQTAIMAQKIYAVDNSEAMLQVCRTKLNNLKQTEIIKDFVLAVNLPPLDLVITIGVWEYINPRDLYEKIKEMTRPGSKIIVVFPNICNDLNWMRSIVKMSPCWRSPEGGKKIALRPGFIRKLFKSDFELIESASFGMVSASPKWMEFLALPVWKFCDLIWSPFQKLLPLGVNVYYLFERK